MGNELLASKTVVTEDKPRTRTIQGVTTANTQMLGITRRGPVNVKTRSTSFEEWVNRYGSDIAEGFAAQAVRGFFDNGGQVLDFNRVVHYTDISTPATKTSAKGTVNVPTAATSPSAGTVLGSVVGPFNLEPADTLSVDVDAGGAAVATFDAAAAQRVSGNTETFDLADGLTLLVDVDGAGPQIITFLTAEFGDIANATALEVAAVINAKIVGAFADVSTGAVRITSDTRGTDSSINVTGGTANTGGVNRLNFTTGIINGTGDVANIDAVTVAEVKTVVEADVPGCTVTDDAGRARITSNTTGASSSIQVEAVSTADDEMGFDNAVHSGGTGAAVDTLQVDGAWDGAYTDDVTLTVENATSGEAAEFNLKILEGGLVIETFPNADMDTIEGLANNADTGSDLVALIDLAASGTLEQRRPANGTYGPLVGGDDGLVGLADTDFIGSDASDTGLRAFDLVDDPGILVSPDRSTPAMHEAMVTYCEVTRSGALFAVLDPPEGLDAEGIIAHVDTGPPPLSGLSEFAAIYWPRVKVLNPNTTLFGAEDTIVVPPGGHIAGVYARTDASKPGGVYQPPAGVERGILRSVVGFETEESKDEKKRDLVYPKRINPLTTGTGQPLFIDGTRTLKGGGNFPTIAERRGAIFIEQSIKRGIEFARHSNNDETLRATVDRTVSAFLLLQFKQGAFRGNTPAQSFEVNFGRDLNPDSEVFAGKLNGRIGIATQKPADFIILRFAQDTRALDEELAAAAA